MTRLQFSLYLASSFVAVAISVVLLGSWVILGSEGADVNPLTFESSDWKVSEPEHSWSSVRLRIVDDLLQTHELLGLSESEVEALLGPADETEYFSEYDLVYYLGRERSYVGIDSEWLVARLDSESTVSEIAVVRD